MCMKTILFLAKKIVLFNCFFIFPSALAQIEPDSSLGSESSIFNDGSIIDTITGGAVREDTLFHSFQEFNVNPRQSVFFSSPTFINNIFTRVTGNNASLIQGTLGIGGISNANLVLLNPNGIIFGEDAQLNVQGSFLATTANQVLFNNSASFSATQAQVPPLLTNYIPIGLGFGETPGTITVSSAVLDVPSPQTLGLVGGNLQLEDSTLKARGGRIELGSTANSIVNLLPTETGWVLGYGNVTEFRDINLSQGAVVTTDGNSQRPDVESVNGGDIQIQGRQIRLTEGSQIVTGTNTGQTGSMVVRGSDLVEVIGGLSNEANPSGLFNQVAGDATGEGSTLTVDTERLIVNGGANISTTTSGTGQGSDLIITASELVEVTGYSEDTGKASGLFARVAQGATGSGGTLTLTTDYLNVRDGGQISTSTVGAGHAGNLQVNASEIELVGRIPGTNIPSALQAQVEEGATGDGGSLSIQTNILTVLDGAQISTAARSSGAGGNLSIQATNSILLSGNDPTGVIFEEGSSGLFVSAEPGSTRDGGTLDVTTRQLSVIDGAKISADTFGEGDAGNATLNVERLIVQSGGLIRAGSFNQGNGGTLTINATDSIEVSGTGVVNQEVVRSSVFTEAEGSGDAGNIFLSTPLLNVLDQGQITAQALQAGGGNITINTGEINLRNDSPIITRVQGGEGRGGDIEINSNQLIALENSDILATAIGGDGGNISISAPVFIADIFADGGTGIISDNLADVNALRNNQRVDISASSQAGVSGSVEAPDFTFLEDALVELSGNFISPDAVVAGSCLANRNVARGSFTVTGTGGLPTTPVSAVDSWYEPRLLISPSFSSETNDTQAWENQGGIQLLEAQALVLTADGRKVLGTVASPSNTENLICATSMATPVSN
jgi:filamentous hemagglutinin family protein